MGTVTKVMFGLIILSGGYGLYMAILRIPAEMDLLNDAKTKAELNSKAYLSQIDDLNSKLTNSDDNVRKISDDLEKNKKDLDTANQAQSGAQKLVNDANTAKALAVQAKVKAEGDYAQAKNQLDILGPKADKLDLYEKITFKNQPVDTDTIQNYLDMLEARMAKSNPKKTKPKTKPKVVKGTVKNVDPKYGFVTISIGETDTKKGDTYRVTRGGKFVGTINVYVIRGGNSFCKIDKANTTGIAINPLVGDIKAGDDVELKK